MPRILITGCSSGFGQAIAAQFLEQGWEVIATMRSPSADGLPASDRLQLLPLDVTDPDSIAAAVEAAGQIDALVNNAGVGMLNVLEGATIAQARELFETNVLGAMAMTRAVMPAMRARRSGVIVNVSSSVTLRPLPALSIYSASKAALNAFTESFALEAAQFGGKYFLMSNRYGPHTTVTRLPDQLPFFTFDDYESYVARLEAVPAYLEAAKETLGSVKEFLGPAKENLGPAKCFWHHFKFQTYAQKYF